ncbi:MAG: translocation/assembly module TamB domain-containing protein [Candidatus Eiseniibacteriota bacterium]
MTVRHGLRLASVFLGLGVAALVFAAVVVLETGVLTDRIIARVNQRLEPAADLTLTTSAIYFRPWRGLALKDVRVARVSRTDAVDGPGAADYVLSVGDASVGYHFLGLLGSRPNLDQLRLSRPDLDIGELTRWREGRLAAQEPAPAQPAASTGGGVRIGDLRIDEGMIRDDRIALVQGIDVHASLERTNGSWALDLTSAEAKVTVGRFDEPLEMTGEATLTGGTTRVDELHLGVAGGRVTLRGEIGAQSSLLASGFAIPLERIGAWLGVEHPALAGALEFRLLATGRTDSLRVEGGLRGLAPDGTDREIRLAATRVGDDVTVETLQARTGTSTVEVAGRCTMTSPPRLEGVAAFRDLDPAALLGDPDLARVTGLTGAVRFEGTGTTRSTFDGSLHLDVRAARVFGLVLDAATLHATLRDGGVTLEQARLARGESSVSGVASITADNHVAAEFTGTIADLSHLGAVAGGSALEGHATAEVSVDGPLAGPSLEAVLHFEDARVLGASARKLYLTLASEGLSEGGEIAFDVLGHDVGYGSRQVPLAVAAGTWGGGTLTIRDLELRSARGAQLRLRGDLLVGEGGDLSGEVTRLEVDEPNGSARWTNTGPVRVVRSAETLTVSGLDLNSRSGTIRGDVAVAAGRTTVHAVGRNVDLSVFSPFLPVSEELEGTLEFGADAVISADTLAIDVNVELAGGRFGEDVLEDAHGRFQVRDDRIVFEDVSLRSTFATADVDGEARLVDGSFREALADSAGRRGAASKLEFRDMRVTFHTPDADRMKQVFPWFPSPGGRVSLDADVAGRSPSPSLALTLGIAAGRVGDATLDSLSAVGTYDGSMLSVKSARLASQGGVLEAQGTVPVTWSILEPKPRLAPGGEVDVRFEAAALPARALTVLTSIFEMGEGPVWSSGRLVGVVDSLLWLEGEFRTEGSRITIPEFEDPLVDGVVTGTYDREGIRFDGIRFSDGQGGTVTGGGVVRLPNLEFAGMDIRLDGRDFHYRSARGVSGTGDGFVRITEKARSDGKLVGLFAGKFDVERADLDERIFLQAEAAAAAVPDMPAGVQLPEEAKEAPGEAPSLEETPPAPLFLEMRFLGKKNVWLKTEEMEVELAGDATFHINEEYVGLSGETHTLRGRYAVLNTDFDVERAEVSFVDPSDVLASVIDAQASCRVLDENVTFEVSGTIGTPIVVGRTESGMSEAEIYELLALRQKRDPDTEEDSATGVVSGAFLESWGALIATRFGRGIGRELGIDTFDVETVEREGGSQSVVGVGKYIGSDVFVRYRERIGGSDLADQTSTIESLETPERQLLLEYRLSEILQLQGETGVILDDPYVNVDLKAEWGY